MGVSKIRSRELRSYPPGFVQHIFKMDLYLSNPHGQQLCPAVPRALDVTVVWKKSTCGFEIGECCSRIFCVVQFTLQGTNISHLGKRKIIFKSALVGDMLVPRREYQLWKTNQNPNWWFQKKIIFTPNPWGNDPFWRSRMFHSWVETQPPTRILWGLFFTPHLAGWNQTEKTDLDLWGAMIWWWSGWSKRAMKKRVPGCSGDLLGMKCYLVIFGL